MACCKSCELTGTQCGGVAGPRGDGYAADPQTMLVVRAITRAARMTMLAQLSAVGQTGSFQVMPGHYVQAYLTITPARGESAGMRVPEVVRDIDLAGLLDLATGDSVSGRAGCSSWKPDTVDPWHPTAPSESRVCCSPSVGSKYSRHSVALCFKHTRET